MENDWFNISTDHEEGRRLSTTQVIAWAVLVQAFMDAGVVPADQFIEPRDVIDARAYLTAESDDLNVIADAAGIDAGRLIERARHLQSVGWPQMNLKEIYGV